MNILLMLLSLSFTGTIMFFAIYALRPLLGKYFPQWTIYTLYIVVLLRLLIPYSPEFSVMQSIYSAVYDRSTSSEDTQSETAEAAYFELTAQPSITETPESNENTVTAPIDEHNTISDITPDSPALSEQTIQGIADHDIVPSIAASREKANRHNNILSLLPIILLIVWAAVAAVLLLKTLAGYFVFLKRVKERQTIYAVPDEIAERLEKLPPVVRDSGSCSPMVIGLLRPKIILPAHEYDTEKLYCVLLHERTHYRRGDIIVKWLCELACCLYWFLPVMPLLRRELSDACETSCDEKAVSDMNADGRKTYVKTLLATAVDGAAAYDSMRLAPTMTASGRRFQERLKKNMTYKRSGALCRALSILLVCAFISGGILLGGCVSGGPAADILASKNEYVELNPMQYQDWEIAIWDHYNKTSIPHSKNAKIITLCGKEYMSDDTVVSIDLLEYKGEVDLSPLSKFSHIDYLLMYGNYKYDEEPDFYISDFSPVSRLTDLKGLVFEGFNCNDFSFILPLKNLELLSIRETDSEYPDYSFIRSLENLKQLYVHIYDGSDLSFIEGCSSLERFEMNGERGNHVSGSFPHGLTGLKRLVLDGINPLDDYSALNECAEMTYLSLTMGMKYGTGMSAEYADSLFDYSYLRNMPELKSLTVMAASDNAIKNISSVEGLESLIIYLGYPYGGGLEAMSEEEMLRIADSYDLSPLGTLSHLRSFKVMVTSFPSYLNDTDLLEKIAHKINRNILTAAPEGITSLDLKHGLDEENAELLGRFKHLESFDGSLESSQEILSFLSETKEMKELRLYFGDYIGSSVDLSYVGDLPSLKLLSIETYDDIPFTGTDKLSRSGGPEELYLDCTLSSISPDGSLSFLNGMDRLRKLKIHRINNNNTSAIASLSNLEELDIGISFGRPEGEYYDESEPKTEVNVDLSFMARLDQLREIDISVSADEGYVVSPLDLSPLNGKQKLRNLNIDAYTAVPDLSTLTACDELKQIEIWPGESNKYVCMQQARRFAAGNQYFAISERYGGIYLDRVYSPVSAYTAEDSSVSAESKTSETTYPIGTAAVPSLEAVYTGSNNSIAPASVLGGLSLGQLVAAWGEPDGGYDRTMTQTFRVAWWYIDGTDHMLSVKCIGTGSEVFDARIDPLTDPAYPLIDIDSVPDVYHPSDETILTLRQALECVNYAHTMIYRMSLDFPEDEIDDRLAGCPYCWTFAGYDTGFSPYFGSGAPCDEWISDHSHSLVFHSNKDQFPGELMLPVWKIKVHTIDGDGLSYDEIIYVEARRGNMYNATNDGGYMPSPYKDLSLYALMYFTA